jgi:hypothetical protein
VELQDGVDKEPRGGDVRDRIMFEEKVAQATLAGNVVSKSNRGLSNGDLYHAGSRHVRSDETWYCELQYATTCHYTFARVFVDGTGSKLSSTSFEAESVIQTKTHAVHLLVGPQQYLSLKDMRHLVYIYTGSYTLFNEYVQDRLRDQVLVVDHTIDEPVARKGPEDSDDEDDILK